MTRMIVLRDSSVLNKCYKHVFRLINGSRREIYYCPLNSQKLIFKKQYAENSNLVKLIEKYEEKLLYNSTIENCILKLGYKDNSKVVAKQMRYEEKLKLAVQSIQPLPISLKYYLGEKDESVKQKQNDELSNEEEIGVAHFPFASSTLPLKSTYSEESKNEFSPKHANKSEEEIYKRYELMKDMKDWMSSYDNYEYDLVENNVESNSQINYGTPDPNSAVTNIPCGGCGALLHCKDTAIPGYVPSEIFKNHEKQGAAHLSAIVCQRCYFLKEFNLALQVQISSEDYINVVKTIRGKKALVVLLVDLIDLPCSIWPGLPDVLGPSTPILVVGNKVDLLPKDDDKYLKRIKKTLIDNMKLHGFGTSNIREVVLLSAKTGYGIEDLITKLHTTWRYNGDVYLVGCTNVGKSSLFNMLLQSDYCKIQATDLIQRATTSLWPGTTLNLLKFPIMRPSDHKLFVRSQRLKQISKIIAEEKKLKIENPSKYPSLISHVGRSFEKPPQGMPDSFSVAGNSNLTGRVFMGINENHPDYAMSRWCFDTPGVIQPDQILHLLTTEELVITLPKEVIQPETFCVRPGTSLFLAGLARLDYIEGPKSIRLTVFRSKDLPITICNLEDADDTYKKLLGTELFKVPSTGNERLSKWPGLQLAKSFTLTGKEWKISSHDIVLSSAGWVAVNCAVDKQFTFQAWTPEKRGVYLRECLLPKAVNLRGARIRYSVAYKSHKIL